MPESEDPRADYSDVDGSSSSSDDGDNEVLNKPSEQISVKQQLYDVLEILKTEKKPFKEFRDDVKQRLTETVTDSSGPTTLHILANAQKSDLPDNKDLKPLVEYLLKESPHLLLEVAQDTGFTPLHCAIRQQKRTLVRWMCQGYDNIDQVLRIPGNHRKQNCVHLAIVSGKDRIAKTLVDLASQETLALKDEDGNTPLHLAVEYERCQEGQLDLIETIIEKSDVCIQKQPDGDFNKAFRSPYLHHLDTYVEGIKKEEIHYKEKQKEGKNADEERYWRRVASQAKVSAINDNGEAKAATENIQKANTAAILTTSVDREPSFGQIPRRGTGSNNMVDPTSIAKKVTNSHATHKHGQTTESIYSSRYATNGRSLADMPAPANNKKGNEEIDADKAIDPNSTTRPNHGVIRKKVSDEVKKFLKKHYLRARGHDVALDILYGKNKATEKSISFDLSEYCKLTGNEINTHITILNFENILQYVEIPKVSANEEDNKPKVKGNRGLFKTDDGEGRTELESVFKKLKSKGVSTILKVTVDDLEQPAHSDWAISKALEGMNVEVWNWKTTDVCPDMICRVAPDLVEVHLYWTGRNAVLRGWSEEEGLPRLRKLRKVVMHVLEGCLDSREHIDENIQAFRNRLIKQTARARAVEILDELKTIDGRVDSNSKSGRRPKEDVSKRVVDTIKELREALRDELALEILKASKSRVKSLPKVDTKRVAMEQAKEAVKAFISAEKRWDNETENATEALNAAKRRARLRAHDIAAAMAQPYNDLNIQVHYPAGSRRAYYKSSESSNSYLEEPQKHLWIESMMAFKRLLYTAETNLKRQSGVEVAKAIEELHLSGGPITVALIDDGIEVMGVKLDDYVSLTGRSFHRKPSDQDVYVPWYLSSGGHGTVMASQVHRICPRAHLSVLKLEANYQERSGKRRITFKSAAQAIREATRRKVHIISMSWTINVPNTENDGDTRDMKELDDALMEAQKANILMFCSASDEGAKQADTYPSRAIPGKIFKIGGATANGELYEPVGDINSVDFILPGNLVAGEELTDTAINKVHYWSGSSIATALAAGLAALILYCAQIRIVRAGPSRSPEREAATKDFELLRQHDKMMTAFRNIRLGGSTKKYPMVWDLFERKVQMSQSATFRGDPIDLLAEVAKDLCTRL
ncbi:Major intracellular serine protease [Cytospora mali]|uniref:Major intracellular serine protease n=1 Tax=Cytospora mali TaxID=578113 RepID=A0A194VZG6_CYTMA|nr:Major intracellular serine protease [Valsa mali]